MSLKSAPYYWVTCDFPKGEGVHDLSAQEGGEYAAWADEGAAIDQAISDGDWVVSMDGEKHFCFDHPRMHQEDIDDGQDPPAPPYLLINDGDEATLVEAS